MAGSYLHIIDQHGNLGSDEHILSMLENEGDALEAIHELYGMIWWLADAAANPDTAKHRAPYNDELKCIVDAARGNYETGLKIAQEANKS